MTKEMEFAIQQFVGFGHARKGHDVEHLVQAMGLTKAEWEAIKEDVQSWLAGDIGHDDYAAVERYFKGAK
jgi:hypothetical protein